MRIDGENGRPIMDFCQPYEARICEGHGERVILLNQDGEFPGVGRGGKVGLDCTRREHFRESADSVWDAGNKEERF